jgi:hypothetical protein
MSDSPQKLPADKIAELISQGYREKYGKLWPPEAGKPASDLQIEFKIFRDRITGSKCPGPVEAFWKLVDAIWNRPNSTKKFLRTPWADKMVRRAMEHKFLGIAGCASSGKSEFGAVWGILNFFASPHDTKVLLTSTSLKDSRQRIWGAVEEYWQEAAVAFGGEQNLVGELVSASGLIRRRVGDQKSDRQGLALIAGEKSKAKESIGKIIGFKGTRVILIADELPELSEALINAAEANLYSNPDFQMIGIGNPNSYYDPFGVFCQPKQGWAFINEDSEEWETEIGYCIRFDGERSPNLLAGKVVYPWMLTEEKLERLRERLGEKSLRYYRMVRGFWCPTGAVDSIFTEADIIAHKGSERAIWRETPVMVAGFDPAFTNGGDRSVLTLGKFGVSADGLNTLEFVESVELNEDVGEKDESRSQQIIQKLIAECKTRGVHPRNLAIDGTGAGKPFCDMVRMMWSGDFLEVNFGGAASDMAASGTDPRPANEVYLNSVSEIWFTGAEYLRSGQLRGIKPSLARELTARTYETKARGKVQVEPKAKMKLRTNQSPDESDSALLQLYLCRRRLGMASKARAKTDPNAPQTNPLSKLRSMAQRFAKLRKY